MVIANAQPCRRPRRGDDRRRSALLLGSLAGFSFLTGVAMAADQPVAGKKLWLSDAPKFVLLARATSIDVSGADPTCTSGGSSLVLDDGIQTATFLLPCAGWRANASGTFRYKNPSAPDGPSAVKAARIKNGFLKVIGKGLGGLPVPNGSTAIAATFHLDGSVHRYCMTFSGSGDGSRFIARDAPPGSCPSPPPCAATTGGFCWFLGLSDASCDAACALAARTYDPATETYAGSGGSDANCTAVLDGLGVPAGPLLTTAACFDGVGCFHAAPLGRVRCTAPPTNAISSGNLQRACACQ
jgi:hypothetical protein